MLFTSGNWDRFLLNNVVIFLDIQFSQYYPYDISLEGTMPQSQVGVSLISSNLILPPSSSSNTFSVDLALNICVNVTDFVRLAIKSNFWNTLLLPLHFRKEALAISRPSVQKWG